MSTKKIADFLALSWATGLGSGFLPDLLGFRGVGGGTVGSFVACGIALLALQFSSEPILWLLGLTLASFFGGAWTIERAEHVLGPRIDPKHRVRTHDQNEIVIDEWTAVFLMSLGLAFLLPSVRASWTIPAIILGTFLFRAIDILKFWPLSRLEKLSGWKGVMMDDVVGGIIALITTGVAALILTRIA
jgi:phosphatidylglycerophosphatase A